MKALHLFPLVMLPLLAAVHGPAQNPVPVPIQPVPAPLDPPPSPAALDPNDLPDPFGGSGDSANLRLSAGVIKAAQEIKLMGSGANEMGKVEAILQLPDKSIVHVRPGETFTFVSGTGGIALPCVVVDITDQQVSLMLGGKNEVRLR